MSILESPNLVPEGSQSGSSFALQSAISGADDDRLDVEYEHPVVQDTSTKLALPSADDTRSEGPWLPRLIKHDPCAEKPATVSPLLPRAKAGPSFRQA